MSPLPEVELLNLSRIRQAIAMHAAGKIPGKPYVQFGAGVKTAMPPWSVRMRVLRTRIIG